MQILTGRTWPLRPSVFCEVGTEYLYTLEDRWLLSFLYFQTNAEMAPNFQIDTVRFSCVKLEPLCCIGNQLYYLHKLCNSQLVIKPTRRGAIFFLLLFTDAIGIDSICRTIMNVKQFVESEQVGETPLTATSSPQIPHKLNSDRTRAATTRSRRLVT